MFHTGLSRKNSHLLVVPPPDNGVGEGKDRRDGAQGVAEGRPAEEGHAPQDHRRGHRQRCHRERSLECLEQT